MRRIRSTLVVSVMALSPLALAGGTAKTPAKTAPAPKKAATPAPPPKHKAGPMVNAEHKKALAELYAGFKFGMSKDEVIAQLQKKIDAQYEDRIKATTDISQQDRIRRDKKAEMNRIASSYQTLDGKAVGLDASFVGTEFARNTGEALMEQWENQGGKNQRRYYFFYDGKLWKMFVLLDVSILPEDKQNFDTFKMVMEKQYGPVSDVDSGTMTWRAGDFDVRAVDQLKNYAALGLAIEDPHVRSQVEAVRAEKAPAGKETPSVIRAVLDTDHKDHPGVKENDGAVNAVIQANGGGGSAPKK
jgi:hypothetical protein